MVDTEEKDYSKSFDLKEWKGMLPFLKPYRSKIVLICVLMFFTAVMDSGLILYQKYIIDQYILTGRTQGLYQVILVGLAGALIGSVSIGFFVKIGIDVELSYVEDLRNTMFKHLQTLSLPYYNNTPVGVILARLTSDAEKISMLFSWGFVDMTWGFFYILITIISMFILNWQLALVIIAIIPFIVFITQWFQKRILYHNRKVREKNSRLTAAFNEGILGARTSKTLVIEDITAAEFNEITEGMRRSTIHAERLSAIYVPTLMMFGSLAISIILVQGGYLTVGQVIPVGTLAAMVSYASGIFGPIQAVARTLSNVVATQANVERIQALLDEVPLVTDTPEVISRYGDNFHPIKENWESLKGDIDFKDITFMYPDGDTNVLENFNLTVPAGSTIAIVGETGAGKSTLVNLICRFYEPTSGSILIDGTDYRQRSQLWLHTNIGYVLQSPHLFSGSIRENIAYGRPDATDEEILTAARLVSADQVILSLPKGLDSEVGEGGDRLSTGEKQLISFARAVLIDPQIFILDEATSSIDTDTELLIQNAISNILKGRTSFIIAHRLSTIKMADLILVVRDGKIIEQGTHSELIDNKGYYRQLYSMQYEKSQE